MLQCSGSHTLASSFSANVKLPYVKLLPRLPTNVSPGTDPPCRFWESSP
jgi:hypothetical protein